MVEEVSVPPADALTIILHVVAVIFGVPPEESRHLLVSVEHSDEGCREVLLSLFVQSVACVSTIGDVPLYTVSCLHNHNLL